jgi:signal transduction histidine kinase
VWRTRPTLRPDVGNLLLAALFLVAAQVDVWLGDVPGPALANAALLALVAPPLAWRRRAPGVAVTVTVAALGAQALLVPGTPPAGLPYAGPLLIGTYSLGAYGASRRNAIAPLAAVFVGYDLVWGLSQGLTGSLVAVTTALLWLLVPFGAWLLGRSVARRRQATIAEAQTLRADRDREQERLAALELEHARMARELHDILAHSVSLMGVQAGAAEEVLGRDPERARPVLRSIQQTARESVAELRRLLDMLRADDSGAGRAPQPGIHELDALVARMRQAGLPVALRVEGEAHPLAAGIELTAYRVVQEALTNALRHARPSRVDVVITRTPTRLEISIANDGSPPSTGSGGHGLLGMTERVSLYGGTLRAGPRSRDEFRVEAQIPLDPAAA